MLSIAFIHPFLYRYARGIERYTVNLSNALAERGQDVNILTWRWASPIQWPELSEKVKVVAVPVTRYYAAASAVPLYCSHLYTHPYDRVYIHFADYGEAGALNFLRKIGRPQPFTIVMHYPYSQVPHRYMSFVRSQLSQRAESITAVSQFVAREAEQVFSRPCAAIPLGVDIERFKPDRSQRKAVREALGIPQDAKILLTVGALEERKGAKWVLQALPGILKKAPDTYYVRVGDGPNREQLTRLAIEYGVENHFRLLPATSKVMDYFQAADLFLLLAKGEALGLVVLEAMACELPVITSLHPPFDELIQPEWGCQVKEENAGQITRTVLQMLDDEAALQDMGKAGRTEIIKDYTWQRVADEYLRSWHTENL